MGVAVLRRMISLHDILEDLLLVKVENCLKSVKEESELKIFSSERPWSVPIFRYLCSLTVDVWLAVDINSIDWVNGNCFKEAKRNWKFLSLTSCSQWSVIFIDRYCKKRWKVLNMFMTWIFNHLYIFDNITKDTFYADKYLIPIKFRAP